MSKENIIVNAADFFKMYRALEEITRYQSPEKLKRDSEKDWGLGYEESLEMAYENIQQTAKEGIKGVRVKAALSQLQPKTIILNPTTNE